MSKERVIVVGPLILDIEKVGRRGLGMFLSSSLLKNRKVAIAFTRTSALRLAREIAILSSHLPEAQDPLAESTAGERRS